MDAPATRDRLLAAAERLFAKGGEEATSLRAVTREAEANVAAVHYHFGGRDGLLREVLNRHIAPINTRRRELVAAAQARVAAPALADIVDAFVRPDLETLAELRQTEPQMARFIGRAYSQPSTAVAAAAAEQFAATAHTFTPLLADQLPHLADDELRTRLDLVVGIITGLFARANPTGQAPPLDTEDLDEQARRLTAFIVGALSAPATRDDLR
ncbi:TetR/AcrR family transcriptional regulator [Mycobacterium spongiae]|uniref:TetR family transcriptional regulator n=1 Tax=Mycobacterium spongiae TaxID=886343 RepID=A0A975JY30_9MYCO|nr:TetR/AcrR family transcriptional regulator [Mycobacterium spongiae]QUR67807.1 TetR family transcriptional regulator [Mycobacterium spongiae]